MQEQTIHHCKIWSPHSTVAADSGLPGCDTMLVDPDIWSNCSAFMLGINKCKNKNGLLDHWIWSRYEPSEYWKLCTPLTTIHTVTHPKIWIIKPTTVWLHLSPDLLAPLYLVYTSLSHMNHTVWDKNEWWWWLKWLDLKTSICTNR